VGQNEEVFLENTFSGKMEGERGRKKDASGKNRKKRGMTDSALSLGVGGRPGRSGKESLTRKRDMRLLSQGGKEGRQI